MSAAATHSRTRRPTVLVVEDQVALGRLIGTVLDEEGFDVRLAHDGRAGLEAAVRGPADAVILDVALPVMDGLAVCRELRARGIRIPVIMLTARDSVPDRVAGLEGGADDYVTKPFAFEELLARLRVQLRRQGADQGRLQVADLVLDPTAHLVTRDGRPIELSAREFRLLELLMRHAGQVLSREQILDRVWGYDAEPASNVVDLYVHYLRRKMDRGFARPLLHTVRSVGYVLRA